MGALDDILQQHNLKFDDLTPVERETAFSMVEALQKSELTIQKIKDYIHTMRDSVEIELTKIGHENKQDIFLKARLRNYMLLEAFLVSPEKAKMALDNALKGIKGGK